MAKINPFITVTEQIADGQTSISSSGEQDVRTFLAYSRGQEPPVIFTRFAAIDAVEARFKIKRGSQHPQRPFLPASSVIAEYVDNETHTVKVSWTYQVEGETGGLNPVPNVNPVEVQVGTTLQQVTTNIDASGNPITVTYVSTNEDDEPVTIIQGGSVQKQVPLGTLRFSRLEFTLGAGGPDIISNQATFVGKINKEIFATFGKGFVLCSGIQGVLQPDGFSLLVDYDFITNPDSWSALVAYIDPATGQPPSDVTPPGTSGAGNPGGLELKTVYQEADFDDLDLVFART